MSKEDYEYIYNNQAKYGKYGSDNHSRDHLQKLLKLFPKSIIDIGCGHNEFVKGYPMASDKDKVGVDIACPSADVIASAHDLPFKDKEFDMCTSFDVLEHLDEEKVDASLREMKRVSERYFVTVCFKKETCYRTEDGKTLHPSANSQGWWTVKLEEYSDITDIYMYSEGLQGDHTLYIGLWK
ncbi:MAG: class I SAM-dependent methyltransferase [Desulfobacterales bacterium]|nr:class I SAM-dependent methyltransferase [Desulfobacterales bacterium]